MALVPLMDLRWQVDRLRAELDAAWRDCVEHTAFVGGERVAAFERAFAQSCGVGHAVACSSGTDALLLALRALSVGPGHEVILPAFTFFATLEAVCMVGATPVLVDVDEHGIMQTEAVARAITERTRAIVPVLLYGRGAPLRRLQELARPRGIALVVDAAQAHGLRSGETPVASLGTVTCYSFYPGKNLGAFGDAGAAVTDDPELAQRMARYRDHGRLSRYEHGMIAGNHRMDEIQGAVLSVKLPHLEAWTAQRRAWAEAYDRELRGIDGLVLPSLTAHGGCVWHLYVVQTSRRDELVAHLARHEISTAVHYPIPLHRQPACASMPVSVMSFPGAETLAQRVLSLPMFEGMSAAQHAQVVGAVRSFFA